MSETTSTIDKQAKRERPERGVLKHLKIAGAGPAHAEGLEGAIVQLDPSDGPTRVDQAWGILSNVTVEGGMVFGDVSFFRHHPQTPSLIEAAERGLGLFALKAVIDPLTNRPRRVVVEAGGSSVTWTRTEQAHTGMDLAEFWREPATSLADFWSK